MANVVALPRFEAHGDEIHVEIDTALHIVAAQRAEELTTAHVGMQKGAVTPTIVLGRVDVVDKGASAEVAHRPNVEVAQEGHGDIALVADVSGIQLVAELGRFHKVGSAHFLCCGGEGCAAEESGKEGFMKSFHDVCEY